MKLTKQTVYIPVKIEDDSGNYIPDKSLLLVKEQGEMDKFWIDLVSQKQGYFFTPEQLNQLLSDVIKDALNTAADNALCDFDEGGCTEFVDEKSITNTFEETFNKFKV